MCDMYYQATADRAQRVYSERLKYDSEFSLHATGTLLKCLDKNDEWRGKQSIMEMKWVEQIWVFCFFIK